MPQIKEVVSYQKSGKAYQSSCSWNTVSLS